MFYVKNEGAKAISWDWHVEKRNYWDEPQIFKNCVFQSRQGAIAMNLFCKASETFYTRNLFCWHRKTSESKQRKSKNSDFD